MRRSLYKRSNCRSTFCTCFSLHLPDFCPCILTGTLSCGILALHASPQHLLHLPSCLCCALRGCQPVQAEACSQPGVKAAGSSAQIPSPDHSPPSRGKVCQPAWVLCSPLPKRAVYFAKLICFTRNRAAAGSVRAVGS